MMKGQKGITLVALVITIIVMLILVGVTIAVALQGGLIDSAKTAKSEYDAQSENEATLNYLTYTDPTNNTVLKGQEAIDAATGR